MSVVLEGLGLDGRCRFTSDVERIDKAVLAAEVGCLMESRGQWLPPDWPQAGLTCRVMRYSPEHAEALFLDRYVALTRELGI